MRLFFYLQFTHLNFCANKFYYVFFVGHKYVNIMNKKFFVSDLFLLLAFVFLSACKSKEISVSVLLQNVNRSVPSIFYRDMVDLLNNEKYLTQRAEMSDSLYAIALKNEWIPLVFKQFFFRQKLVATILFKK